MRKMATAMSVNMVFMGVPCESSGGKRSKVKCPEFKDLGVKVHLVQRFRVIGAVLKDQCRIPLQTGNVQVSEDFDVERGSCLPV